MLVASAGSAPNMILSPILVLDPQKVERDLAFVMGCLSEVLVEAQEHRLARQLPWRIADAAAGDDSVSPDRLSRAYSIAFHLLSLVEQNAAIQQQRSTEAAHGPSALQALWGQSLEQLRDRGLTADQIAATLQRVQVELVLTAHPTEAKRTIVLEHHRSLYLLLVKRENQVWTPNEQRAIRDEFKTLLSLLWRTGEIFLHKPDVAAERRNVMHYLYTRLSRRPAGARRPAASELGAPGLRPGSASGSRAAAAVPSGNLGGRRSGRAPTGDAGRHAGDARGSAPARVAVAPASARRARPAGEPVGSPRAAATGVDRPRRRSRGSAYPARCRAGETLSKPARPGVGLSA